MVIAVVAVAYLASVDAGAQTVSRPTPSPGQTTTAASPKPGDRHESERSDKLTGGAIETAEFVPDEPDIRLTLNW